jgi:hypothetical protein
MPSSSRLQQSRFNSSGDAIAQLKCQSNAWHPVPGNLAPGFEAVYASSVKAWTVGEKKNREECGIWAVAWIRRRYPER